MMIVFCSRRLAFLMFLFAAPLLGACSGTTPEASGGAAGSGGGTGGAAGMGGEGGGGACGDSSDCAETEYCQTEDRCGLPGTCKSRPTFCLDGMTIPSWCGCDGRTYTNACIARMSGMSPAFEGTCDCLEDGDCGSEEFCKRSDGCDLPGTCTSTRVACMFPPPLGSEVCGCDGNTYDSDCIAEAGGVSVAFAGTCDCIDNDDCDPEDFCANSDGCHLPGTCAFRPPICRLPPASSEVCGCDGITYDSDCLAERDGIRVSSGGPCP